MTSCGCFECICGIEPISNGLVICNREFKGMTPTGMTFGELASMTGAACRPGFMGNGRHFIAARSRPPEEGIAHRLDAQELKNDVAGSTPRPRSCWIENFCCDMIGDETITSDPEELMTSSREGPPGR